MDLLGLVVGMSACGHWGETYRWTCWCECKTTRREEQGRLRKTDEINLQSVRTEKIGR
jgi:hypothetical protein